jgi:hypothetical protein
MSGFRKATREQAKLRLAFIGPAGSGKTYSMLRVATELARLMRETGRGAGRIGLIDTECGSAELYANKFEFETMDLTDHSPLSYVSAIEMAEREGIDILIVDSLSHAWMGKGGALEQVDKAVERGGGNSFSAWRTVTPKHNALVDKILSCKLHLLATIRAKTEYVQEKNDKGKTEIKKLGMAAVQRDGLEYEFTCVGDLDLSNTLKISKTRLDGVIMPGDIFEKPGEDFAKKIYGWLSDGAAPRPRETPKPTSTGSQVADAIDEAFAGFLKAIESAADLDALDRAVSGPGKPQRGTPQYDRAANAYVARQEALKAQLAQGAA